jgi:hypothetical protein
MDTNIPTPDILCEILPRREATSDGLKLLSLALAHWSERELRPGGLLAWIDNIVLTELLSGDDLSEVVFAVVYAEAYDDCLTILRRDLRHSDPAEAAQRLVVACTFHGSGYSRTSAVASLRDGVSVELVEDVLLDGRGWNLP